MAFVYVGDQEYFSNCFDSKDIDVFLFEKIRSSFFRDVQGNISNAIAVRIPISDFLEHFKIGNIKEYAIYTSALIVVYRMLTRSRLMSRQEHLVMVQSFVGNAADMNEFLIASYKGCLLMHRLNKT